MAERPEWLVVNRMRQEMGEGLLHTEKFVVVSFFFAISGEPMKGKGYGHTCVLERSGRQQWIERI